MNEWQAKKGQAIKALWSWDLKKKKKKSLGEIYEWGHTGL